MKGFLKVTRGEEMEFLLHRSSANELKLLLLIAYRARRTPSVDGLLQAGEALVGDLKGMGMSEQSYRTAKQNLETWKFATFHATTKGTIATICDSRVFDINSEQNNGQANGEPTDAQRTGNERVTTNKKEKKERIEEREGDNGPSDLPPSPPGGGSENGASEPGLESSAPPPSANGSGKKPKKVQEHHPDAAEIVDYLNEAAGRDFRQKDCHLSVISARLREPGITAESVKEMIRNQVSLWRDDPKMNAFLTPETLFRPDNFERYHGARKGRVGLANRGW